MNEKITRELVIIATLAAIAVAFIIIYFMPEEMAIVYPVCFASIFSMHFSKSSPRGKSVIVSASKASP